MRWDEDTGIGGGERRFPSTRHSLLEAAARPLANEAMERVIELYWKPVYAFVRFKFGKDNEDAKDLTQAFFASAPERDLLKRFDPQKASFRTYLRMAVERFAAGQHAAANRQKRGGSVEFEPMTETAASCGTPEEVFEREWQRRLFEVSLDDLRALCEASGRQLQLRIFEAYDLAEEGRPAYAELARRFGVTETTVTNYLAWARRTLRGLVQERLQGVTSGEAELRQEIRRLWI